jgi:hypothetical protein
MPGPGIGSSSSLIEVMRTAPRVQVGNVIDAPTALQARAAVAASTKRSASSRARLDCAFDRSGTA